MSKKVNIWGLLRDHHQTFSDNEEYVPWIDLLTFYFFPLCIAILSIYWQANMTDRTAEIITSACSVFVGLLFSVLLLIYDKINKIKESNSEKDRYVIQLKLLNEMYLNTSFTMVLSLVLIFFCILHIATKTPLLQITITGVVIFFCLNSLLTILMIIKKLHHLLEY